MTLESTRESGKVHREWRAISSCFAHLDPLGRDKIVVGALHQLLLPCFNCSQNLFWSRESEKVLVAKRASLPYSPDDNLHAFEPCKPLSSHFQIRVSKLAVGAHKIWLSPVHVCFVTFARLKSNKAETLILSM